MTFIGWIQIALFCAVVVALVRPLGGYMMRVFNGERTFLSPVLRPIEGRALLGRRRRPAARAALGHLHRRDVVLPHRRICDPLCVAPPAGGAAVQPGRPVGPGRGPLVQHRGELHHQYQLAELRRREHDVLPLADARPHPPELPLGGNRHRARDSPDPWLCAGFGEDRRQFLGRRHPLHPLRPVAAVHPLRAVPGVAGHPADARALRRGLDHRGRKAADRGRPGRFADRHQDARHQWRRLLQRERRPSVRESDSAFQLRADGLDLCDRRGADQRVRPHGRQRAAGLGGVRRHGRAVPRRHTRDLLGGKRRGPPASTRSASPAATWRARRCASASSPPRCSQW